jgi:GTP-binding protein YchF
MKLGILGFPFSGKTTVFNALSGANEPLSDFSGGGEVKVRVVDVPDPRLDKMREDYKPKKFSPAKVEFHDLPGYAGSDKFFGEVRDMDAIVRVVRAFKSNSVPMRKDRIDWKADAADLESDFLIQDLAMVEKRVDKLERSSKKPSKTQKEEIEELALLMKLKPTLDAGRPLREVQLSKDDRVKVSSFQFLTLKSTLTLVNIGDDDDAKALGIPELPKPAAGAPPPNDITIPIRARLEAEVSQLDAADRAGFLADFGIKETARDLVVRLSYALLDQISFLTGGDKEVRAWTIQRGSSAVEAARKIHSDIAKGFARAQVIAWADYVTFGGENGAKHNNKMRAEGRDYVVHDGDLIEFLHSG